MDIQVDQISPFFTPNIVENIDDNFNCDDFT